MVQQGIKKALGLARAGAGGNDGCLWCFLLARQASPGQILMLERTKRDGDIKGDDALVRGRPEGSAKLDPRSLEQARFRIFDEACKGLIYLPIPESKGRLQIEQHLFLNVFSDMGREH